MYCWKCGKYLPENNKFCYSCGEKVIIPEDRIKQDENKRIVVETKTTSNYKNKARKKKKKKRGVKIFLFSIISLLIVWGCLKTLQNKRECDFSFCSSPKKNGSDYCYSHTCRAEGCTFSKTSYESYCLIHEDEIKNQCVEEGCTNRKKIGADYCYTHLVNMRENLDTKSLYFTLNSAGGIELNFEATNTSGKTINYVRFDVLLSNAVGDPVEDDISNKSSVSVEIVGPFRHGDKITIPKNKKIIGYCDDCARIDIEYVTLDYYNGKSETGTLNYYGTRL